MRKVSSTALVLLLTAHCLLLTAFAQGTPGTVRYPTNVDTLESLIRIKDTKALTTLSSAMTSSSTAAVVPTGGTGKFDTTGAIMIDDEIMYYSTKTSTGFAGPLVRGACGTTAVRHNAGSSVRSPLTACHHTVLAESIIATQAKLNTAVVGPSSATDNAVARFDLNTGKLIQDSLITISDFGEMAVSMANQSRSTHGEYLNVRPHITPTAPGLYFQGAWIDPFITGAQNVVLLQAGRIDSTVESGYTGILNIQRALMLNPLVDFGNAVVGTQESLISAPDFEGATLTTMRGFHHAAFFYHPGGTFTTHEGIRLDNPNVQAGTLLNNYGLYIELHTAGSTINYNIFSAGVNSKNRFEGSVDIASLNITTGGSATISTGVGSVKMSSANSADNTVWVPINYAGVTYYVPGWPTSAP